MPMIHSVPRTAPLLRDTLRLALAAAVLGALFGLAPLGLPPAQGAGPNHLRIGAGAYGITQHLEIGLNKSLIVDLPADVHEVIVSQPNVAGAIMRHKRRAIIQGIALGGTNIIFLDRAGEAIVVLDVAVGDSADNLVSTLARVVPGSRIEVQTFGQGLVLSGTVESGDDMQKAIAIAAQFVGGDASMIANALTVRGSQQVMLKVTIAEVKREVAKQFGINLSGSLTVDGVVTSLVNLRGNDGGSASASAPGGPGQLGLSVDAAGLSIDASLRALEARGAVRLLAEPTLTALSGKEAEFHVGGEFPIQVRDPATGAVVGIEFKEFGVMLGFTPTVRSNGVIGLVVNTEASELTSAEGALSVRRANTSVELPSGSTLAIGGLIQDSIRQQINRLPGLGDIPILGALFRSRDYVRARTELVILVTPYLAHPGKSPRLPTDDMVVAGDAEAIFLGRMEALYGVGGDDGLRGSYGGSIGFALD
jgi:pilus assembly protein CpaC